MWTWPRVRSLCSCRFCGHCRLAEICVTGYQEALPGEGGPRSWSGLGKIAEVLRGLVLVPAFPI